MIEFENLGERDAWDRYFAAALAIVAAGSEDAVEPMNEFHAVGAAELADDMLLERRKRKVAVP